MHVADRSDRSHGGVEDPGEYREKKADVADLRSSTDSNGEAWQLGRWAEYTGALPTAEWPGCLFHVKQRHVLTPR